MLSYRRGDVLFELRLNLVLRVLLQLVRHVAMDGLAFERGEIVLRDASLRAFFFKTVEGPHAKRG